MKWITFFKPLVTFFEHAPPIFFVLNHKLGELSNSRLSSYCWNTLTHLSHMIWITFWAFDTSGANNQLMNLIYNGVKSHFQKIIYSLDILFKTNLMIKNSTWYDCDISSRRSIIFHKKGAEEKGRGDGVGRWSEKRGQGGDGVKVKTLDNVFSTVTLYI